MEENKNLYQQLGIIQGTLTSLGNTVTNGFNQANTQILEFKDDFRVSTDDQNKKIKELASKIDHLEQFKASYEGAQSESRRTARISGGVAGGGFGALLAAAFEIIKFLVMHK